MADDEPTFWQNLEIWPWKLKHKKTCDKFDTMGYVWGSLLLLMMLGIVFLVAWLASSSGTPSRFSMYSDRARGATMQGLGNLQNAYNTARYNQLQNAQTSAARNLSNYRPMQMV